MIVSRDNVPPHAVGKMTQTDRSITGWHENRRVNRELSASGFVSKSGAIS
jgi:hypothetical protein